MHECDQCRRRPRDAHAWISCAVTPTNDGPLDGEQIAGLRSLYIGPGAIDTATLEEIVRRLDAAAALTPLLRAAFQRAD